MHNYAKVLTKRNLVVDTLHENGKAARDSPFFHMPNNVTLLHFRFSSKVKTKKKHSRKVLPSSVYFNRDTRILYAGLAWPGC